MHPSFWKILQAHGRERDMTRSITGLGVGMSFAVRTSRLPLLRERGEVHLSRRTGGVRVGSPTWVLSLWKWVLVLRGLGCVGETGHACGLLSHVQRTPCAHKASEPVLAVTGTSRGRGGRSRQPGWGVGTARGGCAAGVRATRLMPGPP